MTNEEIFDFYDEHWNDYNKIMDMLHNAVDDYEIKITKLQKQRKNQNGNNEEKKEVLELKFLLQDCQDKLDEETHKVVSTL